MDDVLVVIGGIIPDQDMDGLKKAGVGGIFVPGTPMDAIIDFAPGQTFGAFSYPDATTTSKGIVQVDPVGGLADQVEVDVRLEVELERVIREDISRFNQG